MPRDTRERFIEMSSAQMQAITIDPNRDAAEAKRIQQLVEEFHSYCDALLAERRSAGGDGDDLASIIARSEHDGGPVPHGMAISFIHTFVNAGETTRALISFVAQALAEHPDQRQPARRTSGAASRTRSRKPCAATRSTGRAAARPRRTSSSAGSSSAKTTT